MAMEQSIPPPLPPTTRAEMKRASGWKGKRLLLTIIAVIVAAGLVFFLVDLHRGLAGAKRFLLSR